MHTPVFIKQKIVFRKWSRKAYALFASVGKEVVIGRTSAAISDKSLTKNTSSFHKSIITNGDSNNVQDTCLDDEDRLFNALLSEDISIYLNVLHKEEMVASYLPPYIDKYSIGYTHKRMTYFYFKYFYQINFLKNRQTKQ